MPSRFAYAALSALLLAAPAGADQFFPPAGWQDAPNPLAAPEATVGGRMNVYAGPCPESLNYYLANNTFCRDLFDLMYETLLDMDPVSAEYVPGLARRWSISEDRRTFTFWLDERARWSDGRPVTAQDVLWTYQAVLNPTNRTGPHKVALEKFEPPVVVSNLVIRFTAREVHWRNLGASGGFHVLPRHVFATQDFNKVNFSFPVVSGPYRFAEFKEGAYVNVERRADWWHRADRRYQHLGNFQTLSFRFFAESENAFEALKKGTLDLYPIHMARLWVNETTGDKFSQNWIVRQKVRNYDPIGFQGFAMNLRRPPFDDLRVRQALAHLLDREKMNRTLMYDQYFMHRSYYEDLYSPAQPCTNRVYGFDPEQARALLAAAGWKANPASGALEKDGKPLVIRFLTHDQSVDKFLAVYGADLRKAGIETRTERKDYAAWARDMDEFNFDMTWAAWSAGLFKDPEGMWASKEAERREGTNITGFRDPRVDALIERQRTIFDLAARHAICREIDALVAAQCPYALLWNLNYVRLAYWNKFGTPPAVLSKYGDAAATAWYWWYDEDAAADLKSAMEKNAPLPPRKEEVSFDAVFGGR